MGSNLGNTGESLLRSRIEIREIIWRTEGVPSQSMCAAHEWVGIFPAPPPLHLTAGSKSFVPTAGLELS